MNKKIKKAFTLVELLVVIAILAVLATVSVVGYNSFTKKANQSADQQEMTQINNFLEAEKVGKDVAFPDAIKVIYDNGMDLVARDSSMCYVWNKTENRVEYKDKNESLDSKTYEKMTITKNVADFDSAVEGGGIVYLDGAFDTNDKVLNITKDVVIVGNETNLLVPSIMQDSTNISQHNNNKQPLFILTEPGVTLTLCGVNMSAQVENNSFIAVAANNCTVNLYDCEMNGTQYGINVRNYSSTNKSYWTETLDTNAALDASCNINIKNSIINATQSAINWKFVGGSLNVDNCVLTTTSTGSALICDEGNGVEMIISQSTLKVGGSEAQFVSAQCGATNTKVLIDDCTFIGGGIFLIYKPSSSLAYCAFKGNSILIDGSANDVVYE